jgi:histidine ammonia-lyase
MIMQYCAAALVSENKTLAHPASVDSIPTSANQEDHVSMGATASRHAYQIVKNARNVIAIELICAAQAIEYRGSEKLAPATKAVFDRVRAISAPITKDRVFSTDMKNISDWMKNGDWNDLIVK